MYKAYVRVSKKEQSFGRQIVAISKYVKYLKKVEKEKKEKEMAEALKKATEGGETTKKVIEEDEKALRAIEEQEALRAIEEVIEEEEEEKVKEMMEEEELEIKEDVGVEVLEGILAYKDKMTGKRSDRPYLNKMLNELEPGDTVIVMDITRISRSTRDLLDLIEKIKKKGASIKSLTEKWLDVSDESPNATLILTILSAISQFERESLSQRTKEGLEAARQKGHFGGRPSDRVKALDTIKYMVRGGACVPDVVAQTGLSRATVYRAIEDLRKMGEL